MSVFVQFKTKILTFTNVALQTLSYMVFSLCVAVVVTFFTEVFFN